MELTPERIAKLKDKRRYLLRRAMEATDPEERQEYQKRLKEVGKELEPYIKEREKQLRPKALGGDMKVLSRINKVESEFDYKYWEKKVPENFKKLKSTLKELEDNILEMAREVGETDFRFDSIMGGISGIEKKIDALKISFDRYIKYNK